MSATTAQYEKVKVSANKISCSYSDTHANRACYSLMTLYCTSLLIKFHFKRYFSLKFKHYGLVKRAYNLISLTVLYGTCFDAIIFF